MSHNYKLLISIFSLSFIFFSLVHAEIKSIKDSTPANFSFALIGDLSYIPTQEKNLSNVLAELKKTQLAFVIHDGDLGAPPFGSCSDELLEKRFAQFQALPQPVIYTPGDNDWADCHTSEGVIGGNPLVRLAKLRKIFFGNDKLSKDKLLLIHQSKTNTAFKKYSENMRWIYGNVLFMTLHVVGSNNNLGRNSENDAEYKERSAANLAWLREGFSEARKNNNRAVMIIQQANIFPDFTPFKAVTSDKPDGFADVREALQKEAIVFKKPVVLVHGDSHYFRIDKPLGARGRFETTPLIDNFTRVETFGHPNHHWVQVLVDENDTAVFTFKPRIVSATIIKH